MSTLYDKIHKICEKQYPNELPHLVNYDLACDEEILREDSQAKDTYLWIFKGKTGTNLVLMSGTDEREDFLKETHLRHHTKEARFFWLECTGDNAGKVVETTVEKALKRLPTFTQKPNRKERRSDVYDLLNKYIRDYRRNVSTNSLSDILNRQIPGYRRNVSTENVAELKHGDKFFISILPTGNNSIKVKEITSKQDKTTYIVDHDVNFSFVQVLEPTYLSVTIENPTIQGTFGKVEPISEVQFDKIQKSAERTIKRAQSAYMKKDRAESEEMSL